MLRVGWLAIVCPRNTNYRSVTLYPNMLNLKLDFIRCVQKLISTLSVHTPILFPIFNTDNGKNQNLLDFIPGNVAVTLMLMRGFNGPQGLLRRILAIARCKTCIVLHWSNAHCFCTEEIGQRRKITGIVFPVYFAFSTRIGQSVKAARLGADRPLSSGMDS